MRLMDQITLYFCRLGVAGLDPKAPGTWGTAMACLLAPYVFLPLNFWLRLAVLVDRLSASASEIFAGAMQDYHRALILGGQTFGKGTVQTIQPLNHGELKLTLAKFYRVSGQSTQHQGVLPDIAYPDIVDTKEIGESALPEAMPWDSIKPAVRPDSNPYKPFLAELKARHKLAAAEHERQAVLVERGEIGARHLQRLGKRAFRVPGSDAKWRGRHPAQPNHPARPPARVR